MADNPHPLDYEATLNRMEEGLAPVDPQIALASIAISLVQITSHLSHIATTLEIIQVQLSNGNGNIAAALNNLGARMNR